MPLLQKIELHRVDPFDLLNHPTFRLLGLELFDEIEDVRDDVVYVGDSFIGEGDVEVELGVAVVVVRSSG